MSNLLTVGELRKKPVAVIDDLLMHVMAISRTDLYAYPEKTVSVLQQHQLADLLSRYQQGEPLAYLVEHQPFWELDFKVTADTLIPRPETECLLQWILDHYPQKRLRVLDLGVGCGTIALSLAKARPQWQIDASDKSLAALTVAEQNASSFAINHVNFYHSDWYTALPSDVRYDIIVSNPPYIAENDRHLADLQHEPQTALISGQQGLTDLEKIIADGQQYLSKAGVIVLEHGYNQGDAVCNLLKQYNYIDIYQHKDLSALPRFVTAKGDFF